MKPIINTLTVQNVTETTSHYLLLYKQLEHLCQVLGRYKSILICSPQASGIHIRHTYISGKA